MGKISKTVKTGIPGLKKRGKNIIIDKVVDGYRIYESLGALDLKTAEKVMTKKIASILEGRHFPEKKGCSLTVTDALNIYWKDKLQYLASAKNAKYLLSSIDDKLGAVSLNSLTIAHIERFKRERSGNITRLGKPVSPRTMQAELDILNISLNWMVKNRHVLFNPIAGFEKVVQLPPKKIIIDNAVDDGPEWRRIYNASCDDLKPVILCLYESSMRPKEVFHLEWNWIDEINRIINIPPEIEKTRDGRRIPISSKLMELFTSMDKTDSLVFPSPITGKQRTTIKKSFKGAVGRAGLSGKGITPYALRRTRLTIWDEIDAVASMSAGDHTQSKTHYDHYVKITDERLLKLVG